MLCLTKGKMRLRSHVQVVTLRGSARIILPSLSLHWKFKGVGDLISDGEVFRVVRISLQSRYRFRVV